MFLKTSLFVLLSIIFFLMSCSDNSTNNVQNNTTPEASFTILPDSGNTSTVFQFDASNCSDNEDPVESLQVRWDWENDGIWDTDYTILKTATHQYPVKGTKTIKLEAKDSGGLTGTAIRQVQVGPLATIAVNTEIGSIFTIFEFNPHISNNPYYSTMLRWDWESDGTWDTEYTYPRRVGHQYKTAGTKTVTVEVKSSDGLKDKTSIELTVISLETDSLTDIDGNVYRSVKIGNQWWMAEDLNVSHYRNGDPIPSNISDNDWGSIQYGAKAYGMYNGFAVFDERNIAPEGWHIASDEEWKELEIFLGMSPAVADEQGSRGNDEGGKIKTSGTVEYSDGDWFAPNTGATNISGFSAKPIRYRMNWGAYEEPSNSAYFWTSTKAAGSNNIIIRYLYYGSSQITRRITNSYNLGYSIRCVKD